MNGRGSACATSTILTPIGVACDMPLTKMKTNRWWKWSDSPTTHWILHYNGLWQKIERDSINQH